MPIIYGTISGAIAYGGYKAVEALNSRGQYIEAHPVGQSFVNYYRERMNTVMQREAVQEQEKEEKKKEEKNKPRFDGKELGNDPTKCPGEGFEWRGNSDPKTGKGAWYNPNTGESLHPDLEHPSPKAPHWDYKSSDGISRIFTDGTWELKSND